MVVIRKGEDKKTWRDWKWLFSILSYNSKTWRDIANHVYVKDGVGYTTDGHRMYALVLPVLVEDGSYRVSYTRYDFILSPNPDGYLPDFLSVWPRHGNGERCVFLHGDPSRCLSQFIAAAENPFNVGYIFDAFGIKRAGFDVIAVDAYIYGKDKPVAFVRGDRISLVMPMAGQ